MCQKLDIIHDLEQENELLKEDISELNIKIESLESDKFDLECELQNLCDNGEEDQTFEQIHWLYYDICNKVDNQKQIDVDTLNKFFLKTIDKGL